MNGALGRRAHGVKTDEGAGRHENTCTDLSGAFNQVCVFQELRNRKRHENTFLVDYTDGDFAEQQWRQTFNDDVAIIGELGRLADGDDVADLRQSAPCLLGIAHRNGSEREARNTGDQALCNIETDSAEAGHANLQGWFILYRRHFLRPVNLGLRFSMKARTPSA